MSVEIHETTQGNTNGIVPGEHLPPLAESGETDPTTASLSHDSLVDGPDDAAAAAIESADAHKRGIAWTRLFAFGLLPALALVIAIAAGFLKWQDSSLRDAESARLESMTAAKDSTIALLSYKPDTVEKDLNAARDRLTGGFRASYTALTHDVVIPGAKQKQISAVVSVPAVASVSASPDHAVVLVFVNQTVIVGSDPPTPTSSSVQVTLDKVGGHWLISDFTPV